MVRMGGCYVSVVVDVGMGVRMRMGLEVNLETTWEVADNPHDEGGEEAELDNVS